jgi:FkbM family methyltransferase
MRDLYTILTTLEQPLPNGIMQIGANTGQEIPYFYQHGLRHAVMIEPLPAPFAVLAQRCQQAGYLAVQALCDSRDGNEIEFHISSNNGESSSLLRPTRHLAEFPWVQFPETIRLNTFTLDRIYYAVQSNHPAIAAAIDTIFIDVQGAELRVLQGANNLLQKVRYIFTEVGIGGGYEGDIEALELAQFLRAWGFKLVDMESGREGWGNALFIKDLQTPARIKANL